MVKQRLIDKEKRTFSQRFVLSYISWSIEARQAQKEMQLSCKACHVYKWLTLTHERWQETKSDYKLKRNKVLKPKSKGQKTHDQTRKSTFCWRYWNELYLGGIDLHQHVDAMAINHQGSFARWVTALHDGHLWNQSRLPCNATQTVSMSHYLFSYLTSNTVVKLDQTCHAMQDVHSAKCINIINLPWVVGSKASHWSFIAFSAFFSVLTNYCENCMNS